MKEITEDIELCEFDTVTAVHVYKGSFWNLERAELTWRIADEEICNALGMEVHLLKLSEIQKQLVDTDCQMITIFINEPLTGSVLQYGNYGDEWYEIGTLSGYA